MWKLFSFFNNIWPSPKPPKKLIIQDRIMFEIYNECHLKNPKKKKNYGIMKNLTHFRHIYHPSNQMNKHRDKFQWCDHMTLRLDSFHTGKNMPCHTDHEGTLKIFNIHHMKPPKPSCQNDLYIHGFIQEKTMMQKKWNSWKKSSDFLECIWSTCANFKVKKCHTCFAHVTFEAIFTTKTMSDMKLTISI